MNVADKDLCKELYELSGWDNCRDSWHEEGVQPNAIDQDNHYWQEGICPAYSLGYLLRKLPPALQPGNEPNWLTVLAMFKGDPGKWYANYLNAASAGLNDMRGFFADTPEDAVCKLAIELFKQGILKP